MAIDAVVAEILREQGKLAARLDAVEKAICCADEAESEHNDTEEAAETGSPNPMYYSNQLELDIPPIF